MSRQKDKELISVPTPVDSVAAPRTKEQFKFPTEAKKIKAPKNFNKAMQRLQDTGSLSLEDFDSAADVGAFIDFYNESMIKGREDHYNNEILEISKFLAKVETQKNISMRSSSKEKQ